jgi:hypothetical protein
MLPGKLCDRRISGFKVLAVVIMKSCVIPDTTPRSPVKFSRSFGGTYCQHKADSLVHAHAGFLLALLFDSKDGSDMFLRNVI